MCCKNYLIAIINVNADSEDMWLSLETNFRIYDRVSQTLAAD